ncbi:unnamed protein product [Phytophthora lilii]|uniref:Unnamed protein product n=1 Tax=Phytophthora lilii TaxID=2077276 RepID=A0A9W6XK53_9STRA|nr:unnamed protein product [Phytophthora lilii]
MVKTETTDAVINRGNILEAEKILDHKKTRSGKYEYLIKWLGNEPDSWEPSSYLRLINKNRPSELEKEYFGAKEIPSKATTPDVAIELKATQVF